MGTNQTPAFQAALLDLMTQARKIGDAAVQRGLRMATDDELKAELRRRKKERKKAERAEAERDRLRL